MLANTVAAFRVDAGFTASMTVTILLGTIAGAIARRRLMDANAVGARWDVWHGQRVIRWSRVAGIELDSSRRQLVLHDTRGRVTRVPIPAMSPAHSAEFVATLRGLHEAVRGAEVERVRVETVGREPRFAPLDRSERTIDQWQRDVVAIARREEHLREISIEPDDLVRVLADREASAERRLGAAMALGGCEVEAVRQRARAAAATETDRRIRVALVRACDARLDERSVRRAMAADQRRAAARE